MATNIAEKENTMAFIKDNFPPGPCGVCGAKEGIHASGTREWVAWPHIPGGHYVNLTVKAECLECGHVPESKFSLVKCWGGQPGYAVGCFGPKFESASKLAGWRFNSVGVSGN